ncbi:glycosyltransferase family 2 protein [uncultured Roseobacter sp.]|uniref:glycosyltransferase family 2 protein n=1 Tax=uncultured Roseobacter sp. TaxID=114847 RepID=UPI002617ACD6|nr:glycosyltransferase family 2 protein [uncultured Roseobacter sp.]
MTLPPWTRYKLRLIRKRLLWRGFRSRHDLTSVQNNTSAIAAGDILLFATVRDEALRLPHFLAHYRRLGVRHFLIVDNGSADGTDALLRGAPDVSVWQTHASYKAARFGVKWLAWLLRRYGHGHWTLTVDADELLIYPDHDARDLVALTGWLDARRRRALPAMLLDLYPKGSPDAQHYTPADDPVQVLPYFDPDGYWQERRGSHRAINTMGGPRARVFFEHAPDFAPVLSKLPLVSWHRSYAYLSSTHVALPPVLNTYQPGDSNGAGPSGALLHSKFLPGTAARARVEQVRGQQYTRGPTHDAYYNALGEAPDMWTPAATRFTGWEQLVGLGLMRRGDW